jgi:hypothetical protein
VLITDNDKHSSLMTVKSFMVQDPGCNPAKVFEVRLITLFGKLDHARETVKKLAVNK